MFSKYIKATTLALALIPTLLLQSCNQKKDVENTTTEVSAPVETDLVHLSDVQMKNVTIKTGQLSTERIAKTLRLTGKIDVPPQNLISVTNPLGGYLKSTKLLPGMQIKKGQVIAVMEDPQYVQLQQNYLIARDKYEYAKLDYERQKDLNASKASSDKVMQLAQSEMNSQKITMNALAQQLSLININAKQLTYDNISKTIVLVSPITGFVSNTYVNVGKYVTPSDVLFEIIDPSDIHLNLKVYEKDLDKLEIGQRIISYTNSDKNTKHNGEIILISMDVNNEGASEVHCHLNNYDKKLLPGMYMNADIETHANVVHALPEESIVYFEGKNFVFVEVEKQTYQMQLVTIGNKENGFVQIDNFKDLENKNIVTTGAYTLLMKLKNTEEEE
ncbi:efflux RND transporter periplasmic adaptor subunit [Myroides pelagicus]|uniref:Efflux RND transporter periplasmic adaptor subunit n=1 Tax=Myroides pelagicus TaxID=270914 RepID=A0A7K1GLH6_9FLAO|nr:efflux RND transporter periplasmic adaptor subunit [Myroides pelagicus]MEC4112705.1 efflux RND transporter periplasmic adaptor subunit [Myroides pelagicus]MTH29701.1 efflux RND transporter periplasmic adaptor subunit [Myroides pelagicus]